MHDKFIILILITKLALAQIGTEFWGNNDKLTQLRNIEAPAPMFEDVGDFNIDNSDTMVFRDNDLLMSRTPATNTVDKENNLTKNENIKIEIQFENENKIVWPSDSKDFISNNTTSATIDKYNIKKQMETTSKDDFKILFPSEYNVIKTNNNELNVFAPIKEKLNEKDNKNDNVEYISITQETTHSENICTYIKKAECYHRNGFVYKQIDKTDAIICCILPLPLQPSSKITFPDSFISKTKRYRRSPVENINPVLKQRNVLLKRKYDTISSNQKEITSKIVSSEEDYIDPYWNIKGSNTRTPNSQYKPIKTNSDCYHDYVGDYISEVPKPGLLGVYSDHAGTSYGGNGEDYDYNDEPPGYSTIDPRRSTVTPPHRRIQSKPFTGSEEDSYRPESQTISYQSSPDFQVLQGFKLLNLARNKNKFYSKNIKKTMSESIVEKDSEESIVVKSGSDNNNFVDKHNTCGTAIRNPISTGKQIGNAENGSHPWLALVVETKRRSAILCYATIVHPRAAITSADCVHGASTGEITLIAGLWDLKDRSQSQNRLVSIIPYPQYKPNDLAHNLAVLYWTRPLILGVNVQPACLGEPQGDEDCKLFGWGGYDQAIRSRSRWQSATILTPRQCNARLSSSKRVPQIPTEAFCASVQSRGTVSGVGGPLICDKGGRSTATGVAVWRDTVLVFMPADGWPRRTVLELLAS